MRPRPLHVICLSVWVVILAACFSALARYENTPGEMAAQPPINWPQLSRLSRTAGLPTIVLMLHPLCSCSRATLDNLARIMPGLRGKATLDVVFISPAGVAGSDDTHLFHMAKEIPSAEIFRDTTGRESSLFGSRTSGETFLYSSDGSLVFHGGLTAGRSHEGDNDGLAAVADYVESGVTSRSRAPVFGCGLSEEQPARNRAPEQTEVVNR